MWRLLLRGRGFGHPSAPAPQSGFPLPRPSAFIPNALYLFFIKHRLPMQRVAPRIALSLERLLGVSLEPRGDGQQMTLEELLPLRILRFCCHRRDFSNMCTTERPLVFGRITYIDRRCT